MKVTVIKKTESVIYNGNIYGHGESFEVDDLIGESLMKRGYVAIAVEATDEADVQTGVLDEAQLHEMSYNDVKSLAAQMGLDAKGKKDELIARICAAEVSANTEAEDEAEDEPSGDLPDTSMPE